jgi:hypothetical protein
MDQTGLMYSGCDVDSLGWGSAFGNVKVSSTGYGFWANYNGNVFLAREDPHLGNSILCPGK